MPGLPDAAWIVGCGDIGLRLGRLLGKDPGGAVTGWVKSEASAARVRAAGLQARQLDLDDPIPFLNPAPRRLYWFAPPAGEGFVERRLRHFLAALKTPPERLVYLSTSAVYGDCGGRWIDEDTPLAPQTERGQRRLDGERAAADYGARTGASVVILRVPGIYGPGRLPRERLTKGLPILRVEDSPFTNRIHADDLAAAARCVAESGENGCAYHVSDGHPTTMSDYFLRSAALLGLPAPPQLPLSEAKAALSPALMSFLGESKRLRTERLRGLGWAPRYASLESGLPGCLVGD